MTTNLKKLKNIKRVKSLLAFWGKETAPIGMIKPLTTKYHSAVLK